MTERTTSSLTGADLAALRREAGLTQTELAQAAGIGRHAVSYWETKPMVDARQVAPQRMLTVLGVKVSRAVFRDAHARARGDGVLELERKAIAQMEARRAVKAKPEISPPRRQTVCGAQTRKGQPCRLLSEPGRTRCKFHGGKSTGPRTTEGRERIAEAQRRRRAEWHLRMQQETTGS